MKGYFKGVSKFPIRLIPITILVMILYTALSLYLANYSRTEMNQQVEILVHEREALEWSSIEDTIEDAYTISKKDSKILALEVEYALRTAYPDLDDLEKQFDDSVFTTEFNQVLYDILGSNGDDTNSILTLVGTEYHLITMFANNADHLLTSLDSDTVVTWSDVSKITPNAGLTDKAIKAITSRSNNIIYTVGGDDATTSRMSMTELKRIYEQKGIEGLEDIVLLAPAYITDSGDIFGTEDKNFLKSNDNHKIIIVNAVRMSDILKSNSITTEILETTDNIYNMTYSQGDRNLFISILWAALSFLLSLYLIRIYNTEEQRGHLYEETEGKGGNDEIARGE